MSSGQVAGLIDDLPSCAELIDRITADAEQRLVRLSELHLHDHGTSSVIWLYDEIT
jgi:hypothetical protein